MEELNRAELERAQSRIMEMNNRARDARERHAPPQRSNSAGRCPVGGYNEQREAPLPQKNEPPAKRNSVFDIINFKSLAGDGDRSLLVGIMLLLGADAADEKLMLALLYIMM